MSENSAKNFAVWFSAARQKAGITLDVLEDRTGVKKQHLSTLERATTHKLTGKPVVPKRQTVEKIAKALNAPISEALAAAGYTSSDIDSNEKQKLVERLAAGVMASGFDDLRDEDLLEDFLADMQTIAESMLKRKLDEQNKRIKQGK